jgi:4-hydroxybenzoate polyprenyltransferase
VILVFATGLLYGKAIVGTKSLHVSVVDVIGVFGVVGYIVLARVFDEHKDYEFDVTHLADRPLPRGAISWSEVNALGFVGLLVQVVICVIEDAGIGRVCAWWAIAFGYLVLTRYEFFIRSWLRRHFVTNTLTHLPVYCLVALWSAEIGAHPRWIGWSAIWLGGYMYVHTFSLDLWRKSHAPEDELPGVDSYTAQWGTTKASVASVVLVATTAALAGAMLQAANVTAVAPYVALAVLMLPMTGGLVRFARAPNRGASAVARNVLIITVAALDLTLILSLAIGRGLS